jgi:site-specific DNA-methyltransferase (adenine-specific)
VDETSPWRLHLGDCLDPLTGLAQLADGSADHVICDPPFEAEAHSQGRRLKPAGWRATGQVVEAPLPFDPIDEDTRRKVAAEMARVARRWVLIFCQIEASREWTAVCEAVGLRYKRTCIWLKPDGQPQLSGDRPGLGYETIVLLHAEGRTRWNRGGAHGIYNHAKYEGTARMHPTQKPESLMCDLVADFTDPGDLICDPFAGSGTTGVAAIRLGRRFVGWEKDPGYYQAATRRLLGTREQLELGGGLRVPRARQLKLGGT